MKLKLRINYQTQPGEELWANVRIADGDDADIDLRSLPAETYIIKNGTVTHKIQKK